MRTDDDDDALTIYFAPGSRCGPPWDGLRGGVLTPPLRWMGWLAGALRLVVGARGLRGTGGRAREGLTSQQSRVDETRRLSHSRRLTAAPPARRAPP